MKRIGGYEVRGLLGRGGAAKVYKVAAPAGGGLAALKLFHPRPELLLALGEDELRAAFRREAQTLAGLRHPNLVEIHDQGEHQGRPFYVMDYFCRSLGGVLGEGFDLEEATRILTVDEALDYGLQTLAGLDRLHQAGLAHCDIKPDNLLLTPQDQVRLGDLGLARHKGEAFRRQRNLLLGSPFYAAPEQEADPRAAAPASDLYALGVTFLRMLTGRLRLEPGQKPSSLNPDLDQAWDAFLAQAMAHRPELRFASAAVMSAELERLGRQWRDRKEASCALTPKRPPAARTGPRRESPRKVAPRRARQDFGLDRQWRPLSYGGGGLREMGDQALFDPASGLAWQRQGSPDPLGWREAGEYCRGLARETWAGITGWRLPTIDELLGILRPPARAGDLCVQSAFGPEQRWLWSSDLASFTAAWYASVDMGYVSCQDFSCAFYARAVSSALGRGAWASDSPGVDAW